MRKSMLTFTVLIAAVLASGCATTQKFELTSDYDRSTDFSGYRTFGFIQPLGTDTTGYESLVTQTLKAATRREMEARGYTYAETGADLLLNFNAKLEKQTRVTQMPYMSAPYYAYRGGFYGGWAGYGNETRVTQYDEGTLNIDLVDARRKQLVWEGVAVGRITQEHRENREASLNATVAEVFAKYPFRAGQ
ncbi:MAG TPA: DUF4136 domain-containing protein [Thermomonas sp.]|nr:DUF4136 domain-containing protein [Thermomonas sp.]